MRTMTAWLLVLASAALMACGGSPASPAGPTSNPVVAPATPPPDVSVWQLTSVETAVTGPDNCFIQAQVRAGIPRSVSWVIGVIQTGNAISFAWGGDIDLVEAGTLEGDAFTALSLESPTGFPPCADGTSLSGTFQARVTGTFSEDHKQLTAKETWTYSFATGEITMFFDWTAVRE